MGLVNQATIPTLYNKIQLKQKQLHPTSPQPWILSQ